MPQASPSLRSVRILTFLHSSLAPTSQSIPTTQPSSPASDHPTKDLSLLLGTRAGILGCHCQLQTACCQPPAVVDWRIERKRRRRGASVEILTATVTIKKKSKRPTTWRRIHPKRVRREEEGDKQIPHPAKDAGIRVTHAEVNKPSATGGNCGSSRRGREADVAAEKRQADPSPRRKRGDSG